MREHMGLFRGKRIDNGEWVEGCLLKATLNGKTAYLIFGDNFSFVGNDVKALSHALVDPDTIGECTALKDKNGKLIWEGDIVEATIVRDMGGGNTTRKELGVIGYDKIGMLGLISYHYKGIPVWTDFFEELALSGLVCDYYFEIIGNIHDNPELLKGGEG